MTSAIKAQYSNGTLTPLEPLDLEEGAEVVISIDAMSDSPSKERIKRTLSAAGGWKDTRDPDELVRMLYQARLTRSREHVDL